MKPEYQQILKIIFLAVVVPVMGQADVKYAPLQSSIVKVSNIRRTAAIEGDWKEGIDEAWKDAKKKAFEKALNAYKITSQRIGVKGKMRRVKITIEWTE